MIERTTRSSRGDDFEAAGRFYPSLHAYIQAGCLEYQPEKVTFAEAKAIALLHTGGACFYNCACGDFTSRARELCGAISITQVEAKKVLAIRMADGTTQYPMFAVRHGDTEDAVKESRKLPCYALEARVMLSCGWGMFLVPGTILAKYFGMALIPDWLDFVASPSMQCAVFMRHFDALLRESLGDFELAASMYFAGNTQKTRTQFGKRAQMTLNRLLAAGHRAI